MYKRNANIYKQLKDTFFQSSILAIFFYTLIGHGEGSYHFFFLVALFLGCQLISLAGSIFLTLTGINNNIIASRLFAFVLGVLTYDVCINALCEWFNLSALAGFLIISFLTLVLWIYINPHPDKSNWNNKHNNYIDLITLAVIGAFVLFFCWHEAGGLAALSKTKHLTAWIDYYFHGAQIATFADEKAIAKGDIFLTGVPLYFYHRSIYMLPAVVAQVANLPGLTAATSVLFPLGVLIFALSLYVLGSQLVDRYVGVLAVACVLVLPDGSLYWLKNNFLGLHYTMHVAPGTAYGIATCLASMIFFIYAAMTHSKRCLLAAVLLSVIVFFLRVHFFLIYFPVLLAMLVLNHYWSTTYRKYIIYFTFVLLAGLLLLISFKNPIHDFWLQHSVVLPFLDLVHLQRGMPNYTEFYQHILSLHNNALTIASGLGLFIFAILGVWLWIYMLTLSIKVYQEGWELIDFLPLGILIGYMGLVLFAPGSFGHVDEWQHRPLGLLYTIVVIFSVAYGVKLLTKKALIKHRWQLIKLSSLSVIGLGVIMTAIIPENHLLRILFTGAYQQRGYNIRLNDDILNAALYLRENMQANDVYLLSADDRNALDVDSTQPISSITGMPTYIGHLLSETNNMRPARRALAEERLAFRSELINASGFKQAFKLLQTKKINWYVALTPPIWDSTGKQGAFKSGSIVIYHVSSDI